MKKTIDFHEKVFLDFLIKKQKYIIQLKTKGV